MTEARSYASLSSGLLARKGAAKPAMRPQGFGQFTAGIEDLGWNDMGQAVPAEIAGPEAFAEPIPEHVPSSISALTPAPRPIKAEPAESAPPEPAVVEQRRVIAENMGAEEEEVAEAAAPEGEPVKAEVVSMPPRKPAAAKGKKAAFTLRLDPDRHLRLRLACAIDGRSAQQIVTAALDSWLQSVPEVETMAERAAGGRRN